MSDPAETTVENPPHQAPRAADSEAIAEFISLCHRLFGRRSWYSKAARALEVDPHTPSRWARGTRPVPPPILVALRALYAQRKAQRALGAGR